jgi:hypothetical protein
MTSNHDELERLARVATPGPWAYADNAPVSYGSAWVNSPDVKNLAVCDGTRRSETHGFCLKMDKDENERNAAFIAAANPATILALLSANREMREALETATDRVEFLEDNLLIIAERDRHYRSPPKPKPDGGLRGWAGHRAVWALTGQNGSYVGDDEVKTAVMEARSALTTQRGDGE